MRFTDKNLRHGPTATASHHLRARLGTRIDVDLLDSNAFTLEKLARTQAVGAPACRIHHDLGLAHAAPSQPRVSGRFSVRHAASPPRRLNALVNPCATSCRTAEAPREPVSSYT